MRGSNAILRRIPENIGGVYAWYRRFEINPVARSDPEAFVSIILKELYKPHSATREVRLSPSTKLVVQPETVFSKHNELKRFSQDPYFRELLILLLENSLLFQQPLYIGKANNLHRRISTHLHEGSILRERLEAAHHNLDKCRLLLVGVSETRCLLDSDDLESEDDSEDELYQLEAEQLIEDILSRLFLPSFTIKYG